MADGVLLWAYGVVPRELPAPRVRGLVDRPVTAIVRGSLALLTSEVPASRFSGEQLQRRLEDLETLGELARAHDAVLDAALAQGDVVPFRMCTLFQTPEAIQHLLATDSDRFARALARLHGKAEWGVKAFARPRAAAVAAGRPASGAEYLARRRAQRDAVDAVDTAVADVHARLAERASAAVVGRPQDPRLSGREEEMLLNGAYLVAREHAAGFAALVEALGGFYEDDGLALELTGPWPPYHFVAERPQ